MRKRQRGDSNPCGQSPMDFESISLAARTHCHLQVIGALTQGSAHPDPAMRGTDARRTLLHAPAGPSPLPGLALGGAPSAPRCWLAKHSCPRVNGPNLICARHFRAGMTVSGGERGQRLASPFATARLAQPAERKALNLVVVGSSSTVGFFATASIFLCDLHDERAERCTHDTLLTYS